MKTKILALILLLPIFLSCAWPEKKAAVNKIPSEKTAIEKDSLLPATTDTILLKDINNDKIDDTAFVYTPPTFASYDKAGNLEFQMGCEKNNCFNKVSFSCALPEIVFEESVWASLENAGDLNGDGISELLFMNDWFIGSTRHLYLYSYRNGKWEIITKVQYRRGDEPLKSNLIKKGRKYFLRGVEQSDGDEIPHDVEIKLKK